MLRMLAMKLGTSVTYEQIRDKEISWLMMRQESSEKSLDSSGACKVNDV